MLSLKLFIMALYRCCKHLLRSSNACATTESSIGGVLPRNTGSELQQRSWQACSDNSRAPCRGARRSRRTQ